MEPQSQHLVSSGRQTIAFSGATLHFEAFAATIQALEAIYRASPTFGLMTRSITYVWKTADPACLGVNALPVSYLPQAALARWPHITLRTRRCVSAYPTTTP